MASFLLPFPSHESRYSIPITKRPTSRVRAVPFTTRGQRSATSKWVSAQRAIPSSPASKNSSIPRAASRNSPAVTQARRAAKRAPSSQPETFETVKMPRIFTVFVLPAACRCPRVAASKAGRNSGPHPLSQWTSLLSLPEKAERFHELEAEISSANLYDDPRKARETLREHTRLKELLANWEALKKSPGRADRKSGTRQGRRQGLCRDGRR